MKYSPYSMTESRWRGAVKNHALQLKYDRPHYPAEYRGIIEGKDSIITIYIPVEYCNNKEEALIKALILATEKGWSFRYLLDRVKSISIHAVSIDDL